MSGFRASPRLILPAAGRRALRRSAFAAGARRACIAHSGIGLGPSMLLHPASRMVQASSRATRMARPPRRAYQDAASRLESVKDERPSARGLRYSPQSSRALTYQSLSCVWRAKSSSRTIILENAASFSALVAAAFLEMKSRRWRWCSRRAAASETRRSISASHLVRTWSGRPVSSRTAIVANPKGATADFEEGPMPHRKAHRCRPRQMRF